MQPHEQRVIDERDELSTKLNALGAFITTPKFRELEDIDRTHLRAQAAHMRRYLKTLDQRIGRFDNA